MKKSAIKIRTDYVPKAKRIQAALSKGPLAVTKNNPLRKPILKQICPQCKQEIPVDELEKHMRIELMDPKWKIQRDREMSNKRESNLAVDDGKQIAKNIERFASVRKDIFGGDEFEMQKQIMEQKKQAAMKESVTWDGHANSINQTTRKAFGLTNVEDLRVQVEQEKSMQFGPSLPPPESIPLPDDSDINGNEDAGKTIKRPRIR